MIKSLQLEDFQAHKKLCITFTPGITTIIGDTDVGKSAVIRALRWVCQNVPQGAEFVRWGSKCAVVSLEVEESVIVRSKGKSENGYLMNGDEFKAFGTGVPDPITKVLKLSDLNFQEQHDAPFWLSIGGSEVARQMNRIVNLEIIDGVLANVATRLRKAKDTAELVAQRRDEAKVQLESMAAVPEADEALQSVERSETAWQQKAARAALLAEHVENLTQLQTEAEKKARGKRRGEILLQLADEWNAAVQRTDTLQSLVLTMQDSRKAMSRGAILQRSFEFLEASWDVYFTISARRTVLEQRLENQRSLWRERKACVEAHRVAFEDLKEKTGNVCPICGNPLGL